MLSVYGFNMILKFTTIVHKFSTVINISKNNIMNGDKCYFRYIKSEEKVDISFLLKIKDTKRQFNFSRQPSETLETLFNRIETNIQKVLNKKKSKKCNDASMEDKIKITIFGVNNTEVSDKCSCIDLFKLEGPLKLEIYNHIYDAEFNAPWIMNINLPKTLLVGFPVFPENFETMYTLKEKSIFKWYKGITINDKGKEISDCHVNWTLVANKPSYVPNPTDIDMKLKLECIPANDVTVGPSVETISKGFVEAGPGPCPFETRHLFTSTKLQYPSFRCVTYNILADLYCDSDFTRNVLHPYCPPYALQIDYRKHLIMKELQGYNADIICLQEVDRKVFQNSLKPFLELEGIQGLFYKKGKTVAEGLACFYRQDRFTMVKDYSILLADALKTESCLQHIWNAVQENERLKARILDRSTVASATILQSVDNSNNILIVGNTHLYFHPDADHIRLLQGGIVINWLMEIRDNLKKEYPDKTVSLILCGDFNSVPSCGIYRLYTMGIAPNDLPDWTSKPDEAVKDLYLCQDFDLGSAGGTPPFTNFTAGFADCLDYIFYDQKSLGVEQVIPFPSLEELQANTALPSVVFPSDHIAVISDLKFRVRYWCTWKKKLTASKLKLLSQSLNGSYCENDY